VVEELNPDAASSSRAASQAAAQECAS
jgi:hypothetical protein